MSLRNVFNGYYVDWETANVVLGMDSAIDMPILRTTTVQKAHEFIVNYGYDPNNETQWAELQKLRQDALHFMEHQLLADPYDPRKRLEISETVKYEEDIRNLMVWAATDESMTGRWACSLLRVMHTLTHVNNDLSVHFFPAIQKQILDTVLNHVYTDPAGDVYLGQDETGIRLYMLDIKTQKSYESLVLKLLHKAENTGADIFDRIGFRFVTFTKFEALAVLNYLSQNVFAFPNIKASRSRNTLLDIGQYHAGLDAMRAKLGDEEIDARQLEKQVVELIESENCRPKINPEALHERNVYSSTEYSSIQVTCRQLVRIRGGQNLPITKLMEDKGVMEFKFYFPYEIQILDKNSYIESRRGRASHTEYKRAQLTSVRERVFPWLFEKGATRPVIHK